MSETGARMRPLGLAGSVVFFGVPSLVVTLSLFVFLPWLVRQGASQFATFTLAFGGPLALMLVAALVAYRIEGHPWTWPAFRDRMRLGRLNGRGWLLTVLLCLLAAPILGAPLVGRAADLLSGIQIYTPPKALTDFMGSLVSGGNAFLGIPLHGNWGFLLYYLVFLFVCNILGEELWWRGYILPRQELAFGRNAWIANAVLWVLFHAFYHWTLNRPFEMLPDALFLAFVCQKERNTWPGIIGHFVENTGIPLLILSGIMK
jgi:hypothetical protein